MSLLATLIVGALIGGVGGFLLQENFDLLLLNLLTGIIGAILGGVVYFFTSSSVYLSFSWTGLLASIVGALILVMAFSFIHRASSEDQAED